MSQKKEFLRKISKKARQELKLYNFEKIKLFDTDNQAFIVANELLKFFYPDKEIIISKDEDALIPYSLEEMNSKFLASFLQNKKFEFKNYFLTGITHKDLEEYAELMELEKKPLVIIEEEANNFIQELTKEQEQTPMALHNSFNHLRKIFNNQKQN